MEKQRERDGRRKRGGKRGSCWDREGETTRERENESVASKTDVMHEKEKEKEREERGTERGLSTNEDEPSE